MDIRAALRGAAPRLYGRLSHARRVIRLMRELRDPQLDVDVVRDVVRKAGGRAEKSCPLCGFVGSFRAFGSPPRWNAQCPGCGSLERHRHLALVLRTQPVKGLTIHFAPEPSIARCLSSGGAACLTADLHRSDVDVNLNIEQLAFRGGAFDAAVCSHVLEHVDDRRALAEIRRVLKPGGLLILMVPVIDGCAVTYEDASVTSPLDRETHFGQHDHLRVYGADVVDRVSAAGFEVAVHTACGAQAVTHGLLMGDKVFVCRKGDEVACLP